MNVGFMFKLLGQMVQAFQPEKKEEARSEDASRAEEHTITHLIISERSHSSKDFSHPSKPFQALAISF